MFVGSGTSVHENLSSMLVIQEAMSNKNLPLPSYQPREKPVEGPGWKHPMMGLTRRVREGMLDYPGNITSTLML